MGAPKSRPPLEAPASTEEYLFTHPDHHLPSGAKLLKPATSRFLYFAPTAAKFADQHGCQYRWNTRGHRKGRFPALTSTPYKHKRALIPRLLPIWFNYDFRDISYWVGLVFTLGCVAWVVNGHYALYPTAPAAGVGDKEQAVSVSAIAALVGGTLFEIGSWLLYWEALNPEPDISTGRDLHKPSQPSSAAVAAGTAGTANGGSAGDTEGLVGDGLGPKQNSKSSSSSSRSMNGPGSNSNKTGVSLGGRYQQKGSTAGGRDHVLVVQEVGGTPAVQHELIVLPNRRPRRYNASGMHIWDPWGLRN